MSKIKHKPSTSRDQGIAKIENLIDEFGKKGDDFFLAMMEEMVDRAQVALDARREELELEK